MSTIALPTPRRGHSKGIHPSQIVAYAIVLAGAVLMLAPFYFMFIFATHSDREILSLPPPVWFGDHFDDNLKLLLERLPHWWHNLGWSVYVALAVTAANLLLCSLAGYAFAMFEFRYKKQLFLFVMGTMLLPSFVGMIPTALIMSWLGWMNEPKALIVPAACGALGIFMMRQYIASAIPRDLLDAARIDGCSEFGIYVRIVLPLIGPALGTLGLVTFIASWNNFMGPLIVMRDMEMYTVPLALRSLQGTGQTPWGAICAGSSIAVLPLLVMFALASRRLIEGLTAGAVKA
ncbi:carbohydrate ABC transporter permease [Rhizobacter sp. J219]|uniref:carbohydrate ABC transporter permease n=1 Tax=Rhizobacter sp. J219 TaxID=2898430 RepID=UPI0021515933|nr:carbohydrate ABC transporter permease [Rhizobacter sp. J219]MCR5884632.1 carbohydrate ABC transporter permease [Rhizobacter sp. J219]